MNRFVFTFFLLLFSLCIKSQKKENVSEPEIYNLNELSGKKAKPLAARKQEKDEGTETQSLERQII